MKIYIVLGYLEEKELEVVKTWKEIQEHIHSDGDEIGTTKSSGKNSFNAIIMQIVVIDFVFSFDSILAAVGLSGIVIIMVSALVARNIMNWESTNEQ